MKNLLFALVLSVCPLCLLHAQDTDGDGLPDALEEKIGTSTTLADTFTVVETIKPGKNKKPGYRADRDVIEVAALHAGENRNLWRITFAAPPEPATGVLHLYVDSDNNPETGRRAGGSMGGTDYMLSMVKDNCRSSFYDAEGNRSDGPVLTSFSRENSLYFTADFPVASQDGQSVYSLFVLSHDATSEPGKKRMTAYTRRFPVKIPLIKRKKIKRLCDITESEGFTGTFDLDQIRQAMTNPQNILVRHDQLELNGYEVDHQTSQRFPRIKRVAKTATATCHAPAGSYHLGILSYDRTYRNGSLFLKINGEVSGAIMSTKDNNRFWLRWTKDKHNFKGGETVELYSPGSGPEDTISALLFLPTAPEAGGFNCKIESFSSQSPVGEAGTVRLSWITTEPTKTTFAYGPTTACNQAAEETPEGILHRLTITGLDPNKTYHARITGTRHDNSPCTLENLTFSARPPTPPATVAGRHAIPLRVRNPHNFPANSWPVTSGIPFKQGVLASDANLVLKHKGHEIPVQIRTTARWLDGSVKWILLNFLADADAGSDATYTLEYGQEVSRKTTEHPQAVQSDNEIRLQTSAGVYRLTSNGKIITPSGAVCHTTARFKGGAIPQPQPETAILKIEENGPIRSVASVAVDFTTKDDRGLGLELRLEAYASQPFVRLYHTFVVKGKVPYSEFEELEFIVPGEEEKLEIASTESPVSLLPGTKLLQRNARETRTGDTVEKQRLTGAVSGAKTTIALRNFWQNYPKSVHLQNGGIHLGLCPDFEAGYYDEFPFEKEGHHLYFYLLNGVYKFKQGMAKTHEILLAPGEEKNLATLFQRPLLATAPPRQYCESRAFYDVAPRDPERFKAYEESIDKNIENYAKSRERQQDYGLMNFGDWYGERGSNWGNIEYDTQHALLLEYIRSGNEHAFFLADETERHNRDIDTVNWSPNPKGAGLAYIHQMGHVGGYYDKSVPNTLGFPKAGGSVSHSWAEGHFNHYFLTGDPRSLRIGRALADYYTYKFRGWYDFTTCRVPGWHLKINAIAYASTGDPVYLNASKIIVNRVLETQGRKPNPLPEYQREPGREFQIGGWSRMMVPGHCHCTPRHRGNAGFMVAVLLSGLKYYQDVTGDPLVKQAIIDGARHLIRECYSADVHGFRYTSCPQTGYRVGTSPLMVEGIARAYRWTRDPVFLDPITNALAYRSGGSGYGKSFSMYYRMAPRLLADLAACNLGLAEAKKITFPAYKPPAWCKDAVVIQAEDFTAEGDGAVQIRSDRPAWGKLITYWHKDKEHWIEWKGTVPEDGNYHFRLRYASGSPKPQRDLRIDGNLPFPEAAELDFPPTGGFGQTPAQWKIRTLIKADGTEFSFFLKAGQHTIRMSNLGDGMAVDFLALVRSK